MECVRVGFAPTAEPVAVKQRLERAVRSVNRVSAQTLFLDFFAFAEIPVDDGDEDAETLSGSEESAETPVSEETVVSDTPAPAESPFFCILLCPAISRELLAELAARAGEEDIRMSFSPLAPGEAEEMYREALDTCREETVLVPELASACEHLGLLLSETGRVEDAERLYREALDGYRALTGRHTGMESAVAGVCCRLARLLYGTGRAREAEKLYCEAMDIYRELSKRNSDYQPALARTCQELAECLWDGGRPEAAEWFFRTSLDICRKLAGRNAEAYAPRVAEVCGNLAGLLQSVGRTAEAAGLYRVALDTYAKLVQENPARWEPALASLYEIIAAFELDRSLSAGKALLQSAYLLYQKYPDLSPEAERVQARLREL